MSNYDGTLSFDTKIDSSGFQDGLSKIGNIASTGLKATTAILSGAATGIAALGGAAIKVGMDFETGMSTVAAISGAAGEELDALTEKAKEMGAKTKFSAGESAEAFQYMAMAGWKTDDMLNSIEGIMNLAAASGEDLGTTSDIVTDAMTALGMAADGTTTVVKDGFTKEVSNATHFADVLAAASSNANTNVAMMGDTFKYVAPVAGALGYSAEDVATAVGLMANSGIKASQAGTALRSTLTRMAKPTKESQAAMDLLGVSITNADGSMKPLSETMEDLRDGFAVLSEAEKAETAAMLAGQEGMSGLLAIANASDADFEKLQNAIYGCDGAAQQMAETMMDNLAGAIEEFTGAAETLGLEIYEGMQEPLKETVQYATTFIDRLMEAFDTGGMEGMVAEFGSVLSDIVEKIAEYAPSFIDMAVHLIENFCQGLIDNEALTDSASDLIVSLVEALASAGSQIWTTAIVLIGRLAGEIDNSAPEVVDAIFDCLTDLTECIVDWMPDLMESASEIMLALAQGVVDNGPLLLSQFIFVITDLVNGIAAMLPEFLVLAVDFVVGMATSLVENAPLLVEAAINLIDSLIEALIEAIPALLEGAVTLFTAIVDAIPIIIEQLLAALPDIITSMVEFLVASIPQIIDAAIQMLNGIIEAIPVIIEAIVQNLPQIITALVEGLVGALPQLLEASITLLMAIIDAIPEIVVLLIENMPQIITAIITGLTEAIPEVMVAAVDLLGQVIDAIPDIANGVLEAMPQVIDGIVNGLLNGIEAVVGAVGEVGSGIIEGFKEVLGIHSPSKVMEEQGEYLLQGLLNGIADLPEEAMTYFKGLLGNITNWKKDLVDTAVDVAAGFTENILSGLSGLPDDVLSIGSNIVSGLWDGISSGWSWLTDKIAELADGLLKTAKEALEINSPSRVFKDEVGVWIPSGVGEGIKKAMPDTLAEMEAEMAELTTRAKNAIVFDSIQVGNPVVATQSANALKQNNTNVDSGGVVTQSDTNVIVKVYIEGDAKGMLKVLSVETEKVVESTGINPLNPEPTGG